MPRKVSALSWKNASRAGKADRRTEVAEFHVKVGDGSSFSKTVGEYDVYSFAGITGDFSPNHVNKSYMEKSSYGRLQAHGALMVGYMSTASTLAIAHTRADADETPVS